MFGNLLSTVIRTVTLPVDAVNASLDVLAGGDGAKEGRLDVPILGSIEQIRDAIAEAAEDMDE